MNTAETTEDGLSVGKITKLTDETPRHDDWGGYPPKSEPPQPPPDRDGRRLPDKPGRLPLWQELTLIGALVLLEVLAVFAIARLGNVIRAGLIHRQENT